MPKTYNIGKCWRTYIHTIANKVLTETKAPTKKQKQGEEIKTKVKIKISIKNHLLSDAGIFNLFGFIMFREDLFCFFRYFPFIFVKLSTFSVQCIVHHVYLCGCV